MNLWEESLRAFKEAFDRARGHMHNGGAGGGGESLMMTDEWKNTKLAEGQLSQQVFAT